MSTALVESAAGGLNPLRQTKPRYGEKVIREAGVEDAPLEGRLV